MNKTRKAVLWLTGRDLLKPKEIINDGLFRFHTPTLLWRLTIGFGALTIEGAAAPNAIHRLLQRIILGFKWEML